VIGQQGNAPMHHSFSNGVVIENATVTVLLLTCGLLAYGAQAQQGNLDRRELATYRLTTSVFERFRDASRQIAIVIAQDASFRAAPLFSQTIVQGGDVIEVSATLEGRLRDHPRLFQALSAAPISARDYTKFALTLVAARLALGFLESGVLKTVPAGAATENVAFVRAHRAEVDDLFTELGIEIWRPPGRVPLDRHDMLTGSTEKGTLAVPGDSTCGNWTSNAAGRAGRPF
jgi:hypothetical protein